TRDAPGSRSATHCTYSFEVTQRRPRGAAVAPRMRERLSGTLLSRVVSLCWPAACWTQGLRASSARNCGTECPRSLEFRVSICRYSTSASSIALEANYRPLSFDRGEDVMDRLQANQQLNVNEALASNNAIVKVVMQMDGNLVLYRQSDGGALWASNTWGTQMDHAVMQGDGNFVGYTAAGVPLWHTATDGNQGAWIVLQNDGNLVVYDSANNPLWASNTVQDFSEPVIEYSDANGYKYNETTGWWKQMCIAFPCFAELWWPDYSTSFFDDVIDGHPVVIQLWKGWCPKFLGSKKFPGGVGAEVGVYHRIPGKTRPTSLPFLPPTLATFILTTMVALGDNNPWWPFPEP